MAIISFTNYKRGQTTGCMSAVMRYTMQDKKTEFEGQQLVTGINCQPESVYLKAHRPVLYANYLTSGTLHQHLAEIDQACNERMEIIVSAMAKQEGVTEALKAADQMEWVRRMNNIRSRAEEIVLTELVYE
ncbi:MAG: TnpV protein [Oscillospiraceae bacterium]